MWQDRDGRDDEVDEPAAPWETEGDLPWLDSSWEGERDGDAWLERPAAGPTPDDAWPEDLAGPEYWMFRRRRDDDDR